MSYNISSEPSQTDSSRLNIVMGGDLNVQHIEAIRTELLSNLSTYNSFDLMLDDVKNVDLTFFQLMASLYYYCQEEGKGLKWNGFEAKSIQSIIPLIGFNKIVIKS